MTINEAAGPQHGTNGAKNMDALRAVFAKDEIFAVADDGEVGRAAAEYGLTFIGLDETEKLPPDAGVVLLLRRNMVTRQIRKMFRDARSLVVPIACFDPGSEASVYTLKMAMLTDYRAAARMGRYWADSISNNAGPLVFRSEPSGRADGGNGDGGHTDLACSLASDLRADAWLAPEIRAGQWISIGTYCELSLTAPSTKDWSGAFRIDGTAVASGVLVARDPRYTEVGDQRIVAALKLRDELAERAPVVIRFSGGVAVRITAGGKDFTDAVRQVTNPDYGLHPLELGIGTNLMLLPHVDWRYNSQLNEGAGAVHIGFGEGMTGAPMHCVVADSGHHFEPAAATA